MTANNRSFHTTRAAGPHKLRRLRSMTCASFARQAHARFTENGFPEPAAAGYAGPMPGQPLSDRPAHTPLDALSRAPIFRPNRCGCRSPFLPAAVLAARKLLAHGQRTAGDFEGMTGCAILNTRCLKSRAVLRRRKIAFRPSSSASRRQLSAEPSGTLFVSQPAVRSDIIHILSRRAAGRQYPQQCLCHCVPSK